MDHALPRRSALLLFAIVVVTWGLNWAVTKVIVHSVFPLWATAIRTAIAAVAATIRTEHAIVGEVFDAGPQPDDARGRIACVAHHWSRHGDELTDVAWHLRYDDEYRLTEAGWRITHRALTINAIETRPMRRVRFDGPAG